MQELIELALLLEVIDLVQAGKLRAIAAFVQQTEDDLAYYKAVVDKAQVGQTESEAIAALVTSIIGY